MSSGVRNLRAMFEQNAASSPEPRGRSPAGSASDDNNSRPTSKVRASFVSVVPPTALVQPDLGVTKGTASNSSAAHRRESFSISQDNPDDIAELKKVVSDEKEERTKSIAIEETIPEQAVGSRESSVGPPPITDTPAGELNLGTIMKGSEFPDSAASHDLPVRQSVQEPAFEPTPVEIDEATPAPAPAHDSPADNPDKPVTGAQEEASLKPANPTDAAAVSGGDALPAPVEDLRSQPAAEIAVEAAPAAIETSEAVTETPAEAPVTPVDAPATPAETKAESPKSATPKAATPKAATPKLRANGTPAKAKIETKKPAAISTTKASTSKTAPAKSPLPPRSAKSPLPPKTTAKAPTTPKRVAAPPASKPAVPAVTKPAAKPVSAREPTKPSVRAPSATAPTAAARAKTAASAAEAKKPAAPKAKDSATTSPPGFKKPKPKSPTRPAALPSRLVAPTAASVAKHGDEPAKPVKKPATTTRPASKAAGTIKPPSRPAAPPATTAKRPESRTSTAGGGGGFLERMMRPTASSAKKTHDKPMSPPRKTGAAKPGVLQKGKKKVEEAAAKVKDAVTTNGHDEHHDAEASENTAPKAPGSAGLADPFVESAPEPKNEPVQGEAAELVPEPIKEEPKEESAQAEAAAQEPESSMVELQTPNFKSDVVR